MSRAKGTAIPGGKTCLAADGSMFGGTYSIAGPYGGRTASVERQGDRDEFAPGERVLWILEDGADPDEQPSWTPVAFVKTGPPLAGGLQRPEIIVFKKHRSRAMQPRTEAEAIASMLIAMTCLGHRRFMSTVDRAVHDYTLTLEKACADCGRRFEDQGRMDPRCAACAAKP